MFDPGVMGTLIVGVNNVHAHTKAEARYAIAEPVPAGARRPRGLRAGVALWLRAVAQRLQPAEEIGRGTSRA